MGGVSVFEGVGDLGVAASGFGALVSGSEVSGGGGAACSSFFDGDAFILD